MKWFPVFNRLSKDVAIDLGTSNTLIYIKERGIVVKESSIVAVNNRTGQILAVGEEAQRMVGKTPAHIIVTRPLVDGIISDFEVTEKMLKYFMGKLRQEVFGFAPRPRVIIGVPLDATEVEKKAVEDVVLAAGAREVYLVENVIAAAVGARLPIQDPSGSMVVSIGGGLTEIAVISLSGVVAWKSLRVAGEELDQEIVHFAQHEFNMLVGERVAEELKKQVGRIEEGSEPVELKLRGRDMLSGLPKEVIVSSSQLRQAIQRPIAAMIEGIKSTLEVTPPELVADIYQRGMMLTGGSAQLSGLDIAIAKATKVPVKVVEDPMTCGIRGMGLILDDPQLLREVALPSTDSEKMTR